MPDTSIVRANSAIQPMRVDTSSISLVDLCNALAGSGYFSDATKSAQAIVKVLAGAELGIPPLASMMGISIIKGNVTLNANLVASLVRGNGYDYRVIKLDNDGCELEFLRGGKVLGRSSFTMADARTAGLAGKDIWKQYPRNMLFARAMTNGVAFHCPEITSGIRVYSGEELGAEVNGETGEVIHEAVPVEPAPEPPKPNPADAAKARVARTLKSQEKPLAIDGLQPEPAPPTNPQPAEEPASDPHQAAKDMASALTHEWVTQMHEGNADAFAADKPSKKALVDYAIAVLGKKPTEINQPIARCEDLARVFQDLAARPDALKSAMVAATKAGINTQDRGAHILHMTQVIGREVTSRKHFTSAECERYREEVTPAPDESNSPPAQEDPFEGE